MLKNLSHAAALLLGLASAAAAQDYTTLLDGSGTLGSRLHSLPGTGGAPSLLMEVPIAAEGGPRFGVLLDSAPTGGGLAAFTFHTPEQGLVEALHLSNATIPETGTAQDRLEAFRALLRDEAVPALSTRLSGMAVETTRNMKLAGFDAVEMTGTASDPTHGPLRWRLLGILNPNSAESFYALTQVATDQLPVTGPENFSQSLSGRLLDTLRIN